MTIICNLADFIREMPFTALPAATIEIAKMHLLDTLGAMLAGPITQEGAAIGRLSERFSPHGDLPVFGYPFRSNLLPAIIAECAATRCTEIDDIHLSSCTTPGSVIIPTALSLAQAGYLKGPQDFLAATVLGYELLIRLGLAINGPEVLHRGIWPTCLGAALGSSTVAARALGLNARQTANALAIALSMSTGVSTRAGQGISSRWLTLGIAAQNGVVAAFSAQEGFVGNDAFLDKNFGPVPALTMLPEKLVNGLGKQFVVDETGIKPYPIGRQALSAVEAFRVIVTNNQLRPESIQEVSVQVPKPFVSMIDHPAWPENRMDTVRSVQYQIALAAYQPGSLCDVQRENRTVDDRMRVLMERIRIEPSEKLTGCFPSIWAARVEVKLSGKTYAYEMLHPQGDPRNPWQWDQVIAKFNWVAKAALVEMKRGLISQAVRNLDAAHSLADLLELLA